jgi:hypothetical protein
MRASLHTPALSCSIAQEAVEPIDSYPVMMRKAGVPLERPSTPGIAESLGLTATEPQDES